ncbi:MAG: aldo/keto reductase [Bacteroidales bacterium]|nr:aldo/keto reductase [Bacteroidales bacterium]
MNHKKIAIGSAQFGSVYGISNLYGITPEDEVTEIINFCISNNINTIDTAYGYSKSEEVLGQNDLSTFDIISKFSPESDEIPSVKKQLTTSLKRLNIPFLYGYLAHRPKHVLKDKKIWDFLISAKSDQLVKKIGFSFNEPYEIDEVLEENMIPDIVQVPLNYFDNRFEKKIQLLKNLYNTEIHIRSVFLQGLFFTDTKILDTFFDAVKEHIDFLQKKYIPLNAFLMNHVITKDYVDKVVIGINNKKQLAENIEGLKHQGKLPPFKGEIEDSILMPSNWP